MFKYLKTQKLRILTLLAGLSYAFLIFSSFAIGWDEFQMIINERKLGAEYNAWGDVIGHKSIASYSFLVKPKDGYTSFPDSLRNLKTNQTIRTKYTEMVVLVPKSHSLNVPIVFKTLLRLMAILVLIALIRIPIHFFKLVGLIKKEFIFEQDCIRLLRWLGLELLFVYFVSLFGTYIYYQDVSSLLSFSNYDIVMDLMDPIWLLLGIIAILIAEIFAKALALKAEQDLTI